MAEKVDTTVEVIKAILECLAHDTERDVTNLRNALRLSDRLRYPDDPDPAWDFLREHHEGIYQKVKREQMVMYSPATDTRNMSPLTLTPAAPVTNPSGAQPQAPKRKKITRTQRRNACRKKHQGEIRKGNPSAESVKYMDKHDERKKARRDKKRKRAKSEKIGPAGADPPQPNRSAPGTQSQARAQ
jgi:hypothetical protein